MEHYARTLSRRERGGYRKILHAAKRHESSVELSGMTFEQFFKCREAVYFDHPELFSFPNSNRYIRLSRHKLYGLCFCTTLLLDIRPTREKDEIEALTAQMAQVVRGLKREVGRMASEEQRVRKVVAYLAANTRYDKTAQNRDISSVLCENKGESLGIAKAFKYLLGRLRIKSLIVIGSTGRQEQEHYWNIVTLRGKSYHFDLTKIIVRSRLKKRSDGIDLAYYQLSDRQISKTHDWDTFSYPKCD